MCVRRSWCLSALNVVVWRSRTNVVGLMMWAPSTLPPLNVGRRPVEVTRTAIRSEQLLDACMGTARTRTKAQQQRTYPGMGRLGRGGLPRDAGSWMGGCPDQPRPKAQVSAALGRAIAGGGKGREGRGCKGGQQLAQTVDGQLAVGLGVAGDASSHGGQGEHRD